MAQNISVIGFPTGPLGANCYLVIHQPAGACVIVDPGAEPKKIISACEAYKPEAVLLTHAHFDHIGAADAVCSHFSIPLYLHLADLPALLNPEANASFTFGYPVQVHTQAIGLEGNERLHLAGMDIQVLHTPGHTPGGVCYLLENNAGILTGDTLMTHGYGRTDLAGGDMRALMQSLKMLFHLTPRMPMYPGHEEPGMVGRDPEEN